MTDAPERLRAAQDVRHVLRRGRRRTGRLVVVHTVRRDDDATGRLAVVASRRVGNAVERNRAKRLLREAGRAVGVADGVDAAFVARHGASRAGLSDVLSDLRRTIGEGPVTAPSRPAPAAR